MHGSCARARRLGLFALTTLFHVIAASSVVSVQLTAQQWSSQGTKAAAQGTATTAGLALVGATVIDVTDGKLLRDQTVLVAGNRITALGPTSKIKAPQGVKTVDAKGKYVVPGFWDMHPHTEMAGHPDVAVQDSLYKERYPQFIASGVTGLREMALRFPDGADSFRVWQRQVMEGKRVGPRAVGPSADLTYELVLNTPDDARRIMDSLKATGNVFVKFHDERMKRELYLASLREARRVGLLTVGHLPTTIPNAEALDSGHQSVEHIIINYDCVQRPDKPATPDSILTKECENIAKAYVRNGTWMTPTIAVDYFFYVTGDNPQVFLDYQTFLGKMHRLGVRNFLAGTDCGSEQMEFRGVTPCHRGFSLLQEIVFLAESGIPPLEALQSATLNPAKYFTATDSLGTVAEGKLADFVVLDGNPLDDIYNVMKIRSVVANGRYFDRAALDEMDPEAIQISQEFLADWPTSSVKSLPTKAEGNEP